MHAENPEKWWNKEIYLNVWVANKSIPNSAIGYVYILTNTFSEENELWRNITRIVNELTLKGLAATHVPIEAKKNIHGDVIVLSEKTIDTELVSKLISKKLNLTLKFSHEMQLKYSDHSIIFSYAWQNNFRAHAKKHKFQRVGSHYIPSEEFNNTNSKKSSFRITPILIRDVPALWIDPEQRIMIKLDFEKAKQASEDNPIPVRVLPNWKQGFVVGVYKENVGDYKQYPIFEYWNNEIGINVRKNDRLLKVKFSSSAQIYAYPEVCVYKEYKAGLKEYSGKKYNPFERIKLSQGLLEKIDLINFLGETFAFKPEPLRIDDLGFKLEEFSSHKEFEVFLRKNDKPYNVSILNVRNQLEQGAEPYTGKIDGKYAVIAPSRLKGKIEAVLRIIEETYTKLNLGSIQRILPIKYIDNLTISKYKEAINEIISNLAKKSQKDKIIVFVIIPSSDIGRLYYEIKDAFFNPIPYGGEIKPIHTQCIEEETIPKILANKIEICENIALQVYLKLYGKNAAIWLCSKPVDEGIYAESGITCYACFDVSRRPQYKTEVGVFTVITDPYGRFISLDFIQTVGEQLSKATFHKIVEKIAQVSKLYSSSFTKFEPNLKFNLKRLVLYYDGRVRSSWKIAMEETFYKGVPEEGLEPIPDYFNGRSDLPKELAIDIIGVNKSPNKRIYQRIKGEWRNVKRGTCIVEGERKALLISSLPQLKQNIEINTLIPLELEKILHFSINSNLQEPSIAELAKEYFYLTYLNWLSLRQRTKFALPHKIAQKAGEYISAQVHIPQNIIIW
jgi:hypothetical protein